MDPLDLDLTEASEAIAAGRLDPVELTEAYLRRIEGTESGPDGLNAWYTVDADGARAAAATAAAEIRSGHLRGPLHGIPVGIKDLFDTAGLRTTYGSVRFRDHVPATDAVAVARLRDAGAVVLGKQATHEFAWGGRTDNPHFGPTHNPHDHTRIPGGSSGGGGASVAARSSLLALGSDTAGSVRIPAALCGCVGLKPTYGWLPTVGAFPLGPSLDHVGLLTRSVRDAALAFGALAGRDVRAGGEPGLRVGLVGGESAELVDGEVAGALASARDVLERSGVDVREVRLTRVAERVRAVLTVVLAEAEQVHHDAFADHPESYGPDLAELLRRGPVGPHELATARTAVDEAVGELRAVLEEVDVLVSATVPVVAPRIGEMHVAVNGTAYPVELLLTRLTSLANAAGLPAVSVPAPGNRRLPVGMQFVGRTGEESNVLRAASRLDQGVPL
jgi:aspartyl-tRNA(Asn)/glutamyl-tRNA(Gln) amidotransferase subunit A